MDKGIWRVARARLCVACLQEMAADYIIEPAFHGWAQGVCQRCGILTAAALEVRVVRVRKTPGATPKRYVEYRDTGLHRPVTEVTA